MADRWLAAVDLGTSAVKAAAWRCAAPETVTRLPIATQYHLDGGPGALRAIARQLQDAIRALPGPASTLAVTGQIGCVMPVDAAGAMTPPWLTWADESCHQEVQALRDVFPTGTGALLGHDLPPHACWSAPKIRCWRRCYPQPARRVARYPQSADLLVHALTGRWHSHPTAHVGFVHQRSGQPCPEMLAFCGIEADQLPGMVRDEEQEIFSAGGDMYCGFIGFNLQPGDIAIQAGTTEIVGQCVPAGTGDPCPRGLIRLPLNPQQDIVYGSTSHGGASLVFLRRLLGRDDDLADLWRVAQDIPPGSDGLIFIPHLGSSRAPRWRMSDRGGFVGLTAAHGPAHLLRAVLEGCAIAKRLVVDAVVRATGIHPQRVRLAGGGARMALANHIRAAALDCPVQVLAEPDVALLGAAASALGARAASWLNEHEHARPVHLITPEPSWIESYQIARRRFVAMEQQIQET